jgi:hypothetical protein
MNAVKNETEKPLLERIAERLMAAQQEIDEMAVQFALGKAEARDKFAELKAHLRQQVEQVKREARRSEWASQLQDLQERLRELEALIDQGNDQASPGAFAEEQARWTATFRKLEEAAREKLSHQPWWHDFQHEMEKAKIKLELIRLKLVLKKFVVTEDVQAAFRQAQRAINNKLDAARAKMQAGQEKYEDFKEDVQEAYQHLRQVLSRLG